MNNLGLVSLLVVSVTAIAENAKSSVRDCGPRAVHAVLRHFERNSDLSSLISEMQPKGQADCSFADIKVALERRGMYVQAIAPGKNTRLISLLPIIVHLENDHDVGHFALLKKVDEKEDRVVIDRIDGTALCGSWPDALNICTEQMLVVCDQDITINQTVVPVYTNFFRFVMAIFAGNAIAMLLYSLVVRVFH